MTALPKDLYVEQGTAFSYGFFWHRANLDANGNPILDALGKPTLGPPYDLTGWTGQMQIRQTREADPVVTLTTAADNQRIRFGLNPLDPTAAADPTNGRIDLFLSGDDTSLLTFVHGGYDLLLLDPNGKPYRLLQGKVLVDLAWTRGVVVA